jgi:hypothetical protein
MYPEPHIVIPRLSIVKRFVVRAAPLMGSGITTANGLEVGHWNIEYVELGGMHPIDCPSISGGSIQVVSIVSIYVFYEQKAVRWMTLVLDKEALSSWGLQPTDLDISLILVEADGSILRYWHLLRLHLLTTI